jgi:hypothetical protein
MPKKVAFRLPPLTKRVESVAQLHDPICIGRSDHFHLGFESALSLATALHITANRNQYASHREIDHAQFRIQEFPSARNLASYILPIRTNT